MRPIIGTLVAAALIPSGGAHGGDTGTNLLGIRPGVMCASPSALASLTLPNGDSRTHAPSPRPQDLAIAQEGGCRDIRLGNILGVRTVSRKTSIVTTSEASGPLVIANIDAQAVIDPSPLVRDGMVRTQHVVVDTRDGAALEVLEDARIVDPQRRLQDAAGIRRTVPGGGNPLLAGLDLHPMYAARLLLVDGHGNVLKGSQLLWLQAIVWPAPIHGLMAPGFMLTLTDGRRPGGDAAHRMTVLLLPSLHGLHSEEAIAADGTTSPIKLGETPKASWTIVPPRTGDADEIELVTRPPTGTTADFVTTYSTYRFANGQWHVTSRQRPGAWEDEAFPDRSQFP